MKDNDSELYQRKLEKKRMKRRRPALMKKINIDKQETPRER